MAVCSDSSKFLRVLTCWESFPPFAPLPSTSVRGVKNELEREASSIVWKLVRVSDPDCICGCLRVPPNNVPDRLDILGRLKEDGLEEVRLGGEERDREIEGEEEEDSKVGDGEGMEGEGEGEGEIDSVSSSFSSSIDIFMSEIAWGRETKKNIYVREIDVTIKWKWQWAYVCFYYLDSSESPMQGTDT